AVRPPPGAGARKRGGRRRSDCWIHHVAIRQGYRAHHDQWRHLRLGDDGERLFETLLRGYSLHSAATRLRLRLPWLRGRSGYIQGLCAKGCVAATARRQLQERIRAGQAGIREDDPAVRRPRLDETGSVTHLEPVGRRQVTPDGDAQIPQQARKCEDAMMKLISAAIGATFALGPLWLSAATFAQPSADLQPNSRITIDYIEPRDPKFQDVYERMKKRQLLEQLALFLSPLKLPTTLRLQTKQCNVINAFYDPLERSLNICYDLILDGEVSAPKTVTAEGITRQEA